MKDENFLEWTWPISFCPILFFVDEITIGDVLRLLEQQQQSFYQGFAEGQYN